MPGALDRGDDALRYEVLVDVVAQLGQILLGQVLAADVRIDAGLRNDLLCSGVTDAVDIGQSDLDSFLSRQVNT